MRWALGGLLVAAGLLIVAVVLLVPRTSGNGWRLDEGAAWEQEILGDGNPTVTIYSADDTTVGIGVTAYGSSSCPPEFGGAEITDDGISVTISDGIHLGGCTADLAPHQFGVLVERDALPEPPFNVVVRHGDRPAVVTAIEALP
jgi:hypothetical protein